MEERSAPVDARMNSPREPKSNRPYATRVVTLLILVFALDRSTNLYTGAPLPSYEAATLPGLREALEARDMDGARREAQRLSQALDRALRFLQEGSRKEREEALTARAN